MKTYSWLNRTILLAFGCFALLPITQAVSPPPAGCYSEFTTAGGCNALFSLTTGHGNTAIGQDALFSDTTGSWNTGVGAVVLGFNNGDFNTAVGIAGLLLNNTGEGNTALGAAAMVYNDTGNNNTATGYHALYANISGGQNTATGVQALVSNTSGSNNTANGLNALFSNTIGAHNTAVGTGALFSNTSDGNVGVGEGALLNNTSGAGNVAVGEGAGSSVQTQNNVICIGRNVTGNPVGSNETYIGNIGTTVQPISLDQVDLVTVRLNDGRLGHSVSSRRYKEDIKSMDKASEALYQLRPVTYRYKKNIDPNQHRDYGLVAEEVAEINPELAIHNGNGEIENVKYTAINAMLLNEFLKEHKKVQSLEATVAQQQKDMKILAVQLKEQAAQVQKVSAQVELNRPAPRTALNNQ
jgi:hypothetical protein